MTLEMHILELALECHAIIVTHNLRDFVEARRFGIEIRTPAEFLEMLVGAV